MIKTPRHFQHFLRTTALCGLTFLGTMPLGAHAFDPNETPATTRGALPSTRSLTDTPSTATLTKTARSVAASGGLALPANPAIEAMAAPLANAASATPAAPVLTAPTLTAPVLRAPAPAYPPVDAATQAAAARMIQPANALPAATIPAITAPAQGGFIAPAPLMRMPASAPVAAPASIATPAPQPPLPAATIPVLQPLPTAPVTAIAVTPHTPSTSLSDETQRILSRVPSKLDTETPKAGKLAVSRMNPSVQPLPSKTNHVETYDAVGLSIKVQRPGLDTNFELNRAYTALMGGETTQAIEIYKNILSSEPANQDALFGLAATYQRVGQRTQARDYYGKLLAANPNHRAGLNNFLALVSEESPESALAELERLEQRNPDFSPIPAQQALVLRKLGYLDRAREKMLRAIELSPENSAYKYNLAVLLDMSGDYANASALYRQLIDAALKGEKLPASLETLQKRLNFLVTATTAANAGR